MNIRWQAWGPSFLRRLLLVLVVSGGVWGSVFAVASRNSKLQPRWIIPVNSYQCCLDLSPAGRFAGINEGVAYFPAGEQRHEPHSEGVIHLYDLANRRLVAKIANVPSQIHPGNSPHSFAVNDEHYAALQIDTRYRPVRIAIAKTSTGEVQEYPWPDMTEVLAGFNQNDAEREFNTEDVTVTPVLNGTGVWIQSKTFNVLYDLAQSRIRWWGRSYYYYRRQTAFSADGRFAACGSKLEGWQVIHVVDLRSGRPIQAIALDGPLRGPVVLQFSSDAESLAIGVQVGSDQIVSFVDVHDTLTGAPLSHFPQESWPTFSRDGRFLATIAEPKEPVKDAKNPRTRFSDVIVRRTADGKIVATSTIPADRVVGWVTTNNEAQPLFVQADHELNWNQHEFTYDALTGAEVAPLHWRRNVSMGRYGRTILPDGRSWLDAVYRKNDKEEWYSAVGLFDLGGPFDHAAAYSQAHRAVGWTALAFAVVWAIIAWLRSIGAIGQSRASDSP